MGRIFISAGHFTGDSGAPTIKGTSEAQEMIKTRDLVVRELESRGLIADQDFFAVPDSLDLSPTIRWINSRALAGDVALEIHGNSGGGRGAEIFHAHLNSVRQQDAQVLLTAYLRKVRSLGIVDRGVKPDIPPHTNHNGLGFCRQIRIPSLLLEVCFMDNMADMNALTTNRAIFAEGIADGLIAFEAAVRARSSGTLRPSAPVIDIELNGRQYDDKGIIVNNNSYIPIDLVDSLGVDLTQQPQVVRVNQGGIVYVKAIDLQPFGISVNWNASARTVILQSTRRDDLTDRIMSQGKATEFQLTSFLKDANAGDFVTEFPRIAELYIEEASFEGVNHDIAFCQMCLETGYLRFGGDVQPSQNNFCGLGAVGGGAQGAAFPDARTGVRAHIQHLKAYASTEPVNKLPIVDPRFSLVTRGIAPTINALSGRWATDLHYGSSIKSLLLQLHQSAGL